MTSFIGYLLPILFVLLCFEGKLILKHFPEGDNLIVRFSKGKSMLSCEIESDGPFKLTWYRNGEQLKFLKRPPWPYEFDDKSGLTLVQWPYIKNLSRGLYECRASNGRDPDVSHKVRFTPIEEKELPTGFPKITKSPPVSDKLYPKQYYGTNITLECDATGNPEIRWFHEYVPLHKKVWKAGEGFDYKISADQKTLSIFNLKKVASSYIHCFVANNVGMDQGGTYKMDTIPVPIVPIAPKIFLKPKNVSVQAPEQWVEFYCNASGRPKPYYTWYHDGRMIYSKRSSPKISVVAMRSGSLKCVAENEDGTDTAVTYLYVRPLPYKAGDIDVTHKTQTSFTIKLKPYYREADWHAGIPITYAILHQRPWHNGIQPEEPFNMSRIPISGSPPWYYTIKDLEPWTWIDVRVRFGNKYGVGNVSDWNHGYTDWADIKDPARNLKNIAHSNQSFTLSWENPKKVYGPLTRYELYWTRRPMEPLSKWTKVGIIRDERSYSLNWHGSTYITDIAPIIYWKVRLFRFEDSSPMSMMKVFRVSPGAPGFVMNVTVKTKDSRSILAYWNATTEPGNGIIGHQVLYNRQDIPAREKFWNVFFLSGANKNEVEIKNLSPNRPYEVKIYPVSHAMKGVPSRIVNTTTFTDVPTAPPTNVYGKVISSRIIEVRFNPPPEDHLNGPIVGYKLFYTRKLERQPLNVSVDKNARRFQLQGLAKFTKYIVWMVAINTVGESPPSKQFKIYTAEEVPQDAPRSIRAQTINDSAITVAWLPPTRYQNGRIIGYKIYYSLNAPSDRPVIKEVRGVDARDGILTDGIRANRNYSIQVAAFTFVGAGTKSSAFIVRTPPKLSESPVLTAKVELVNNVVTLQWRPRTTNNERFKIQYGKSLRKYTMVTDIKIKYAKNYVRSSVIEDLHPGVFYSFQVSTQLTSGQWTASDVKWIKTAPSNPSGPPQFFEATTESSSSIKLHWEEPLPWLRNGKIISYVLNYKPVDQPKWEKSKYNLVNDEDTIVFLLSNLKADTRYQLRVKAVTEVGSGPFTYPVLEARTNKEVLPTVTRLGFLELKSTSCSIQWGEAKNSKKFKDLVFQYEITYSYSKKYRDEKFEMKHITKVNSVKIVSQKYYLDELLPGTTYEISVRVYLHNVGTGDPVNITFVTQPEAPSKFTPPSLKENKMIGNYIPLEVLPASEVKGSVDYYYLVVVDLGKTSEIPEGLNPDDFQTGENDIRQRRSVKNVPKFHHHVAGYFERDELPTTYRVGDGTISSKYNNKKLVKGNYYVTFLRAFVKKDTNHFLTSNSPFSSPIKYAPTVASSSKSSGMGGMIPIIAGAVGGVIVICIAVILIVMCRRRGSDTGSEEEHLVGKNSKKGKKRYSRRSWDPTEIHRLHCNTPGLQKHPPMPVESLPAHVESLIGHASAKLILEFDSIEPGERSAADNSLLQENKTKNRFPNVFAYDHTRVKLENDGTLCSDYINANYIDGYCREKAYIATQGPMKNTLDDFWRLCWEQNVQTIVMMTRLEERERNKCEKYWPAFGSDNFGKITVELKDEKYYCTYCVRTLLVSSSTSSETQTIKQFQYLQWPDPGVPAYPGPFLAFIRRVHDVDAPGAGPTLVHCSAGVGRTACFIAIDAMLERIKQDSIIDIYGFVTMLRSQRNYMVQTQDQYQFIYETLVEFILYGNTEIGYKELNSHFKKLQELRSDGVDSNLETEFKSIAMAVNKVLDPSTMSIALSNSNEDKNRCRTVVPFDSNRVALQPLRIFEGSDYINASYIDGYDKRNAFIATQGPKESTVADFWSMLVEQKSSTVVMLCNLEDKGKEQCFQYWPGKKSVRYHYYVIDPVQENRFANFVVREFKITDARDDSVRLLRQYHYGNWQSGRAPNSSESIIELIGQVQKSHRKIDDDGPIVVHGSTGSGRTGVFICLSIALECLRTERIVDIHQIVKGLRHQRPYMVKTLEQYEFCYQVTCDFLKNFDFV